VLVPGWTDQPGALARRAAHFAAYKTIRRVEILPCHRLGVHKWEHLKLDYKLRDIEPPSDEIKDRALRIFSAHLQNVVLK
jgi:pyruvate formate lyase activating enzyme